MDHKVTPEGVPKVTHPLTPHIQCQENIIDQTTSDRQMDGQKYRIDGNSTGGLAKYIFPRLYMGNKKTERVGTYPTSHDEQTQAPSTVYYISGAINVPPHTPQIQCQKNIIDQATDGKQARKKEMASDEIDGVVWSNISSQDCIWATREAIGCTMYVRMKILAVRDSKTCYFLF